MARYPEPTAFVGNVSARRGEVVSPCYAAAC